MTPTDGLHCFTSVDEPHNGSPDVVKFRPSLAEIQAAADALRDSTKAPELFALCQSLERCEIIIAITAALASRFEVAA